MASHKNGSTGHGMGGILIGAALGAAALAFAHKPTREKVIHSLDKWGSQLDEKKDQAKEKAIELKDKAKVKANLADKEAKEAKGRARNATL